MVKLEVRTALAATIFFGVVVLGFHADAASQRADTPALPDGRGKEQVATLCVGCHDLNMAVNKRATPTEWRETVAKMIDRGAKITSDEAAVIVAYLGEHYGASAAAGGERTASLPDGPGKDVLMNKCFQCHTQTMWNDLRQDRRAWEGVLYRMVGRRALWTEEEINAMADYLARVRGPAANR
jgi:cytochrome c5